MFRFLRCVFGIVVILGGVSVVFFFILVWFYFSFELRRCWGIYIKCKFDLGIFLCSIGRGFWINGR